MQPRIAIALLLLLTACTLDRGTAPSAQPQKSALSQCYDGYHNTRSCQQPLFIIDGKRLADNSLDLNPSEIESVEVFKGAKAIEIYGEEARNGVVVITSRKARATNK